jgi:hypothetical protein
VCRPCGALQRAGREGARRSRNDVAGRRSGATWWPAKRSETMVQWPTNCSLYIACNLQGSPATKESCNVSNVRVGLLNKFGFVGGDDELGRIDHHRSCSLPAAVDRGGAVDALFLETQAARANVE